LDGLEPKILPGSRPLSAWQRLLSGPSAIAVLHLNGSPVLHGAAPLPLVPPGSCVALLLVFESHVSIFLPDRQPHVGPDHDIYPPSRVMFVDKVWYVFESCSAAVLK
jgi:hypothetical protein